MDVDQEFVRQDVLHGMLLDYMDCFNSNIVLHTCLHGGWNAGCGCTCRYECDSLTFSCSEAVSIIVHAAFCSYKRVTYTVSMLHGIDIDI